ncbi:MAG TPA: hypothetical protein VGF48_21460 [Thermoanaerobaculia bacterium]
MLVKLFSRGNRSSDRFYADRARPDRDAKQLARERREGAELRTAVEDQAKKK